MEKITVIVQETDEKQSQLGQQKLDVQIHLDHGLLALYNNVIQRLSWPQHTIKFVCIKELDPNNRTHVVDLNLQAHGKHPMKKGHIYAFVIGRQQAIHPDLTLNGNATNTPRINSHYAVLPNPIYASVPPAVVSNPPISNLIPQAKPEPVSDIKVENPIASTSPEEYYQDDDLDDSNSNQSKVSGEQLNRVLLEQKTTIGELFDYVTDSFCNVKIYHGNLPKKMVLIEPAPNPLPTIRFFSNDDLDRKVMFMNVGNELASVLGGLIEPAVQGQFLIDKSKSERQVSMALLYVNKTETHYLQLDPAIIALNNISQIKATHFVSSIEWGVIIPITVTAPITKTTPKDIVVSQLEDFLENTINGITNKNFHFSPTAKEVKFKCKFFLDESFTKTIPEGSKTSFELVTIINNLSGEIQKSNHNRGMKRVIHLTPLADLAKLVPSFCPRRLAYFPVPSSFLQDIKKRYVKVQEFLTKLHDMYGDLEIFSDHLSEMIIHFMKGKYAECRKEMNILKRDLGDLLKTYHKFGYCREPTMETLLEKYDDFAQKMDDILSNEWRPYMYKIQCIYKWKSLQNFAYVGKGIDYQNSIKDSESAYVFFSTWSEVDIGERGELNEFIKLLESENCVFVDQEVIPENSVKFPGENRICYYQKGKLIDSDLLNRYAQKVPTGLAKSSKKVGWPEVPPAAVQLEIFCPKSLLPENGCEKKNHFWYCEDCQEIYHYLDQHLYCKCGRAPVLTFEFRCPDTSHGVNFHKFDRNNLIPVLEQIKPRKDINILVVGRVGVGKTTWLNAFANYLSFSTLEKARKAAVFDPVYLVPTTLTVQNHRIVIGEDTETEKLTVARSGTKFPREIVFETRDSRIHFIDTPGLVDPDGIETDYENVRNIIKFLSAYNEIHAICILIKPDEKALSMEFLYALNEILSHLHKDAMKNIIFCFTNARLNDYTKDTRLLKEHLNQVFGSGHQVTYSNRNLFKSLLEPTRIYAMDNESIRYIYAQTERRIKFTDEKEIEWYNKSWVYSQNEIGHLIDFIKGLKPHRISDMMALNAVKCSIATLYYVIISIQTILKTLDEKQAEVNAFERFDTDLLKEPINPKLGIQSDNKIIINFSASNIEIVTNAKSDTLIFIDKMRNAYNEEMVLIAEEVKKLGAFLRKYAILPYNDFNLDEEKAEKEIWLGSSKGLQDIIDQCPPTKDPLTMEIVSIIMRSMYALSKTGDTIRQLNEQVLTEQRNRMKEPENIFSPEHRDIDEFNEGMQESSQVFSRYTPAPRKTPITIEPLEKRLKNNDWSKCPLDPFWWHDGVEEYNIKMDHSDDTKSEKSLITIDTNNSENNPQNQDQFPKFSPIMWPPIGPNPWTPPMGMWPWGPQTPGQWFPPPPGASGHPPTPPRRATPSPRSNSSATSNTDSPNSPPNPPPHGQQNFNPGYSGLQGWGSMWPPMYDPRIMGGYPPTPGFPPGAGYPPNGPSPNAN